MAKKPGHVSQPTVIHHPRTADAELTEFRRAVGSIALAGPIPSKYFLDGDDEDRVNDRARN